MTIRNLIRRMLEPGTEAAVAAGTCVPYAGLNLPPARLRRCTAEFRNSEHFYLSAREEAGRLIKCCGMTPASRVLDAGCGAGRLALGIIDVLGSVRAYEGVDDDRYAIEWCRRWIEEDYPAFRFTHLDARNERYSPEGPFRLDAGFRLDFPDGHFDVVYVYSLLTHLTVAETAAHLREFRRLLAPAGRMFFTANLEPDVAVNPHAHRFPSCPPPDDARLDRDFLLALLDAEGLAVERFEEHAEPEGRTGVYATRAAARAQAA